jgi:uncharacterized protein DUF6624
VWAWLPRLHQLRIARGSQLKRESPGCLHLLGVDLGAMSSISAGLLAVALLACPAGLRGQEPRCPPLDSLAPWARVNRAWSVESDRGWSNDSLRHVLLALRDQDQAIRRDFGARVGDTAYARQLIALDSTLASTLTGILDRYGLPTRTLVGAAGADAAMLIVQHSWSLQLRVLALAEALPPGEISPQALAMLEDRVLVHQGQPQRYGTQFDMGSDQVFHFAATDDLPGLEARRARMGLPPFAQYVCLMEEAGMQIDRQSLPRLEMP